MTDDRINLSNVAALDGMGRGSGPPGGSPGYGNFIGQRRDGATNFYHFDGIGSTLELTNGSQVITDDAIYKAFGETAAETGTTPDPHQWVGEQGYYMDEAQRVTTVYDAADRQPVSIDALGRELRRGPHARRAGLSRISPKSPDD